MGTSSVLLRAEEYCPSSFPQVDTSLRGLSVSPSCSSGELGGGGGGGGGGGSIPHVLKQLSGVHVTVFNIC